MSNGFIIKYCSIVIGLLIGLYFGSKVRRYIIKRYNGIN